MRFPKPPKRKRNKAYLAWIASLPCCISGKPGPSQAHHVRLGHHGGMGRKPDDSRALPLSCEQHDRLHRIGEAEFWAGVSPETLIGAYNRTYEIVREGKP